jgi:GTPase SAR1 family protein
MFQTAPVLLGAAGVGKTTLCVSVGKLVSSVVGFDVCTSIRNLDTTDRDTATLLASALVVYADEITGLNTDKSRELITKPKLHLRQLYTHTELKINNVASYWFTSNDSRKVIEDAANNRRFIVLSMKGLDFESIQSISESAQDARNLFAYVHSLNIDILESQKYLEKLAEGANDTLNTVEAQVNYVLNTYFKNSIVDKDESKRTVKVESVDNATIEKLQRLIEQCKVKHLLYKDGAGYITDTLLTWLVAAVMEKIGHGTDYKDVKAALENIKSQRLEHTELALRRGYTVVWTRGNELFNAQPKTGFFLVPSLDAFGEIFEHLEGTDAWLKS